MYWTLELASHLEEAPWPATRDELIDYAIRSGAPLEVIENLQQMEDEGETYEGIEDIWLGSESWAAILRRAQTMPSACHTGTTAPTRSPRPMRSSHAPLTSISRTVNISVL